MDDARLKIIVGADVQQVATGMQQAIKAVQEMEKELYLLGNSITASLDKGQDVAKLEDAYQQLKDKIKAVRAEAGIPLPIPPAPPPLPVPDDTPLLNSLAKQRIAFIDVGRIITGQGFSLRALASNFSLLGPAITIGAAALYGLVELLTKETEEEKKAAAQKQVLINQQNALYDAFKNTNDATQKAIQQSSEEQAKVMLLVAALQQGTLSRGETVKAIKELQSIAPDYFSNLDAEHLKIGTLNADYAVYNDNLTRQIEAQIKMADLTNQIQKRVTFENSFQSATEEFNKLVDSGKTFQQIIDETGKTIDKELLSKSALDANDKTAKGAALSQDFLNASAVNQIARFKLQEKEIIDGIGKINATTLHIGADTTEVKSVIPILEQVEKIYSDISKQNKEPLFKRKELADQLNDPTTDAAKLFQDKIQRALSDGVAFGAKDARVKAAYDDLAHALQAQLDSQQNPNLHSHVDFTLADPAEFEKQLDKYEEAIEKAAKGRLDIKVPAHLELLLQNDGYSKSDAKAIADQFAKEFEKDPSFAKAFANAGQILRKAMEKGLLDQSGKEKWKDLLNKTLENDFKSGFENFGQSIGDALATGKNPIETAGKSILTSLGQLIEDLGKSTIEYGLAKTGLDTILKAGIALPGVAAIAIGVGMEAIGALVKSEGSAYHAFATGGIITGPTLGLVGEAGPEVVFPLDRLNQFVKNTSGNGHIAIKGSVNIRGRDLAIVLSRDDKLQNMTS